MTTLEVVWTFLLISFAQPGTVGEVEARYPQACHQIEQGETCTPAWWNDEASCKAMRQRYMGSQNHFEGYVFECVQLHYEVVERQTWQ